MPQAIPDYAEAYAQFDAEAAALAVLGDAPLNAAVLCCDRHCGADRIALHAVARDGGSRRFTFEELKDQSERFARVLGDNGVAVGEAAFFAPRALAADLQARLPGRPQRAPQMGRQAFAGDIDEHGKGRGVGLGGWTIGWCKRHCNIWTLRCPNAAPTSEARTTGQSTSPRYS